MTSAPQLSSAQPERFYLPELDTLRFFAFLAVFISHLPIVYGRGQPFWSHLLGHGVDLFFALSAYLLTELMLREKERTGGLDLRAFYARRCLRIWPLYYSFMAAVFIGFLLLRPATMKLDDFAHLATFTYELPFSQCLIITTLWSLSLEEQFYLVWPLLAMRISRPGVAVAGFVAWSGVALLRIAIFATVGTTGATAVLAHLDSIFAGLVIVGFALKGSRLMYIPAVAAWIVGTCLLYHPNPSSPILLSLGSVGIGLGSGGLLLSCLGAKALTRRPIVYLGRISYGLYVFHGLALVTFVALFPAMIAVPLALISTVATAAASYRYLERPFLKLKERFQHVRSQPI